MEEQDKEEAMKCLRARDRATLRRCGNAAVMMQDSWDFLPCANAHQRLRLLLPGKLLRKRHLAPKSARASPKMQESKSTRHGSAK